jgi:hypothetical protein
MATSAGSRTADRNLYKSQSTNSYVNVSATGTGARAFAVMESDASSAISRTGVMAKCYCRWPRDA